MTDNTKHTPTPWKAIGNGYTIVHREDTAIVANVAGGNSGTAGEALHNAAFIVRAVNSHAALVESLEYISDAAPSLDYIGEEPPPDEVIEISVTREGLKQLRAALALARGDV